MLQEEKLQKIAATLFPERPIRSTDFLRGRLSELENVERELRYFHAVPFIYGHRGVGKTSLARTVVQQNTNRSRTYIRCVCVGLQNPSGL